MKVYVAFRMDENEADDQRFANGSMTILSKMMKGTVDKEGKERKKPVDMSGSEWTVVLYDFKPNVANVCKAIVDVTDITAVSGKDYRVNDHGQLREVK